MAGEQIANALEQCKYPPSALVPVYRVSLDKALALRGDSAIQPNLHLHLQSNDIARQFNELLDTLVNGNDVNGALNGHAVKFASASEPKPIRAIVIEESPVIPNINSSPEASAR
jgi:hypothetical protein